MTGSEQPPLHLQPIPQPEQHLDVQRRVGHLPLAQRPPGPVAPLLALVELDPELALAHHPQPMPALDIPPVLPERL